VSASVLERIIKAYRIGEHSNRYPIFDDLGSKIVPGRWNNKYPVIYTASNYSLAMLEKLVHCNTGDIPEQQQWIEITIPNGVSYETVTLYSLKQWHNSKITRKFGDTWLKSQRSCILFVPSIISPTENNILINKSHPEFEQITTSINQPVVWDKRLFWLN
jgi:RES domain-containing protein